MGDARFYLNATYPTPASEHEIILTPWNNGTIGTGWALYAGSPEALIQALSFHAQAINRVETWSVMERVTPRFPFLLGNYRSFSELITMSDEEVIKDFSETLEKLVTRGFSGVQFWLSLDDLANISLPGYVEPDHAARYHRTRSLLSQMIATASNYSIKIYLWTDEVVLTEAQKHWLENNLEYDGPADQPDYPDHFSVNAPGFWTFIEEKYRAVQESLQTLLTTNIRDGFGGFYFRTDDLANPYPYKYSLFRNDTAFGRFINITLSCAEALDVEVIQRMWRLGNEENIFNNRTLAQKLLDPIPAGRLILRCKETWNDHWYGHPPNPVIGSSHHKWIIGWYTGAAMPDYKGLFFDEMFSSGWQTNPNVIGYDFGTLAYASFERLDYSPFFSANNHHLYFKRWNENWTGNDTLRKYFYRVGFTDEPTVSRLIEVFNLCHIAFKELSFWKAWTSTGKFHGDILNGGNTIVFEPGRFNNFYDGMQESEFSNDYSIEEGYRALGNARLAFERLPNEVPGYGSLTPYSPEFPLDPVYADADPENMTLQLMTLRGNIRQFRDVAAIFAPYKEWHIRFYEWCNTANPMSFIAAERARKETMAAYLAYQQTWGNFSAWYKTDFRTMASFWLPLVGTLETQRVGLLGALLALIGLAWCVMIITIPNVRKKFFDVGPIARTSSSNEHSEKSVLLFRKKAMFIGLYLSYIILPPLCFYLLFVPLVGTLFPQFPSLIALLATALILGKLIPLIIYNYTHDRRHWSEDLLVLFGKATRGDLLAIGFFWGIFYSAGIMSVVPGRIWLGVSIAVILCAFLVNFRAIITQITQSRRFRLGIYPITFVLTTFVLILLLFLPLGGITAAFQSALGDII